MIFTLLIELKKKSINMSLLSSTVYGAINKSIIVVIAWE
jgi:hypothetical protein